MPKLPRARPPGRNADMYADPKALAAEIVGKGLLAEVIGYLTGMWEASLAPFAALWDTLAPAIGEAITDINKKVFEEGWFGRETTAREVDVSREPPSADMRMGFRELIAMQAAMLPHTPDRADQARHEPEVTDPEL